MTQGREVQRYRAQCHYRGHHHYGRVISIAIPASELRPEQICRLIDRAYGRANGNA